MLRQKLLRARKPELVFKGSAIASTSGASSQSVSIAGLLPQASDLVIVSAAISESAFPPKNPTFAAVLPSAGLTKVVDNQSNQGIPRSNLGVFWGFYNPTTWSTQIEIGWGFSAPGSVAVYLFSGANQSTPLDATTTNAQGGDRPDAPSITTVTGNAIVVAVGAAAGSGLSAITAPGNMTNFIGTSSTFNTHQLGMALQERETAGGFDPFPFGGSASAITSSCAATLAIRPA